MVEDEIEEPSSTNEASTVMLEEDPPITLSEEIRALLKKADGKPLPFGAIIQSFPRRSHAMLLVFLSFPLCLPVGIPILTTLLGPAVALVALFLFIGRAPWIPRRLRERMIPYSRLESVSNRLLRTLKRLERWLHPRIEVLSGNVHVVRVHAVAIILLALVVSIPLPILFANLVAALPIFLIALGLLERDGRFIIAGYVAVLPTAAFYVLLVLLGREGVEQFMQFR
jgi:hypothetical protein